MKIKGRHIALYVAGELIALSTNCALEAVASPVEVASMTRGKAYMMGAYSYTITTDSLLRLSNLPSRVEWAMDAGDRVFTGFAQITNLRDVANVDGYAVSSVKMDGCGRLDYVETESYDFGGAENMGEVLDCGNADNNGEIIDFL